MACGVQGVRRRLPLAIRYFLDPLYQTVLQLHPVNQMLTIFFPKHVFQILCQLHLNRDMDNLFMKSQASELGLLNIASKLKIVTYFGAPGTKSEDCRTRRDLVTCLGLHSRTVRNRSEEVRINLSSATIIPIRQNRWNRLE
jgi:hypothetical protein